MFVNIATLNISGLNTSKKQEQLQTFLNEYKCDILFLQEHNIKSEDKISSLSKDYDIYMNLVVQRGGTGFLIRKELKFEATKIEKSEDSRIICLTGKINGNKIRLINVYAYSGTGSFREREMYFRYKLAKYLEDGPRNTVMAGDWNCVLNERDTSHAYGRKVSEELSKIVKNLELKDVWEEHYDTPVYTYPAHNHGSRLDRLYCLEAKHKTKGIKNITLSSSDHKAVMMKYILTDGEADSKDVDVWGDYKGDDAADETSVAQHSSNNRFPTNCDSHFEMSVINDILCFLACKRTRVTQDDLVNIVCDYYDEKLITAALDVLYDVCPIEQGANVRDKTPKEAVSTMLHIMATKAEELPVFASRDINVPTFADNLSDTRTSLETLALNDDKAVVQ